MSNPISYPNYPQAQLLCSSNDVQSLLFNVPQVANGDVPDDLYTSAIAAASKYMEQQTRRFLSPRRVKEKMDGNGKNRMIVNHYPIINVNTLKAYFAYPLGLTRTAFDYNLVIDREEGFVGFPVGNLYPFYEPLAYTLPKSNLNIEVDYWVGFTQTYFGEALATTDQATYTFPVPGVVKQAINTVVEGSDVPEFSPTIYVNGVKQVNTTYILSPSPLPNANRQYDVDQDNLIYAVNTDSNGIASITFKTPLQPSDVVTADFAAWYIPGDVKDATAKKAAITVLNALGAGGMGISGSGGATRIQIDKFQAQYNDRGQYGPQIDSWENEIAQVIRTYKSPAMPIGGGYSSDKAW